MDQRAHVRRASREEEVGPAGFPRRGPIAWRLWKSGNPFHETVPLTAEELQSLRRVSLVLDRMALPAAHIDKLLDGGYVREGPEGLVVTDLGRLRLRFEQDKPAPTK